MESDKESMPRGFFIDTGDGESPARGAPLVIWLDMPTGEMGMVVIQANRAYSSTVDVD